MTNCEYNAIYEAIMADIVTTNSASIESKSVRTFRWELIKALWEIRDAIKGGLAE